MTCRKTDMGEVPNFIRKLISSRKDVSMPLHYFFCFVVTDFCLTKQRQTWGTDVCSNEPLDKEFSQLVSS